MACSASLDSFDNILGDCHEGPDCEPLPDTGLYTWTDGRLALVARSGMDVAEGEIVQLQPSSLIGSIAPFSGAQLNNSRQVLFQAAVLDLQHGSFEDILYVDE